MRGRRPRIQKSRDLKGHFAVRMPENGLAILHGERQFEAPAPADVRKWNAHRSLFEEEFPADPVDDFIDAVASLQIRKDDRLRTPHDLRITVHDFEVGAD